MNGTIAERRKAFLTDVSFKNVDAFGPKIAGTVTRGVRRLGMVLVNPFSLVGWQGDVERKKLTRYLVEVARANDESLNGEFEDKPFLAALKQVKEISGEVFTNADVKHLAAFVDAFKDDEVLLTAFAKAYPQLAAAGPFQLDIPGIKKQLQSPELWQGAGNAVAQLVDGFEGNKDEILNNPEKFAKLIKNLETTLESHKFSAGNKANLIFEMGFLAAMYALLYVMGASTLMFIIAGALADLAVTVGMGAMEGIGEAMNDNRKWMAFEMAKGIGHSWTARVNDESSLHPIVDAMLTSAAIVFSWGWIDQQKTVCKASNVCKQIIENHYWDYVPKYAALNLIIEMNRSLVTMSFSLKKMIVATATGMFRGRIKNYGMLWTNNATDAHELPWTLGSWAVTEFLSITTRRTLGSSNSPVSQDEVKEKQE